MFVYRNLKNPRVVAWQYGPAPKAPLRGADDKPLQFAAIMLESVTFRESEAAWRRCHRNAHDPAVRAGWEVHAYACGEVVAAFHSASEAPTAPCDAVAITYDKEGCGRFIRKDTGAPITYCDHVYFAPNGHSYATGRII